MKLLILALTLTSGAALAWGPTGHRVVGAVAEKHLTSSAARQVKKILQGHSLSRVANWADEIKSEPENYSHTYNWHYTDWKEEDHQHDETNSSGKLMTAIKEQLAVLKDKNASLDKKNFALKFIVHLIGDLHQPLHVGNGLDHGGNRCKVMFHKKETNLHALWDEGMIDFTKLSYTELADYISTGRSKQEIRDWKKGTPLDWAHESKILRPTIYPANTIVSEVPLSTKQYCRNDIVVTEEAMPKLSYEYSYKFVPVVEKRLYQAGLRLAVLLNQHL
ncbi:MAG: S1/P1 nuclease [Bacteriovoracia bacterium]